MKKALKKCLRAPLFTSLDASLAKKRALSLLSFPNIDKYGRKISLLPCLEYTSVDVGVGGGKGGGGGGDLGSETENQVNNNNDNNSSTDISDNNTTTNEMDIVNSDGNVNTESGVVTDSSIRKSPITESSRDYVDDQCFSLNLSYLPGTPHIPGKIPLFIYFYC